MSYRIRIFIEGGGGHRDVEFATKLTIGRANGNDCVLDDEKASSKHAVIEVTRSGKVQVRDLDSTNGTKVNGARTQADLLQPGDVLQIGRHQFVLWKGSEPPKPPAKMDARHAWHLLPKHGGPDWVVPPRATVGRSPDRDLTLDHETVSAQHATLVASAGGLSVEDHGSSNGTWVDGTKIRRAVLKHGQVVSFGEMAFVVQHGEREVAALSAQARHKIVVAVVAIGLLLGGGILAMKMLGPQAGLGNGPPPGPAPGPAPAPSPGPSPGVGDNELATGAGRVALGLGGAFEVERNGALVIRDGRVVVLDPGGTLRGRQGDTQHIPKNGIGAQVSGRTASGYVWTGPKEGYAFRLQAGNTPGDAIGIDGHLGEAGAPVIGGLRLDVAAPFTVKSVSAVKGAASSPAGEFSVPEADEVLLDGPGGEFPLRFAKGWSVRGRPANGGWQLLIWRRAETRLAFKWELGGRSKEAERQLTGLQADAERAFDEKRFAEAVKSYRELLGRLGPTDLNRARLQEKLAEAEAAAKIAAGG